VIWLGIGVAVTAWLLGLLLEIGPVVHLLLLAAAVMLVVQVRRDRGAAES
jgi:Na+/phosphate symporter